jgi:transcriptional regulator with XRE-family HTH domain
MSVRARIDQLGPALVRLRHWNQWSQAYVADELGISVVHLSAIENGRSTPSLKLLQSIANLYQENIDIQFRAEPA